MSNLRSFGTKFFDGVIKRLGCFSLALALVLASLNFIFPVKSQTVKNAKADTTFDDLSQSEIVEAMGAGWNLGNQLEANNNGTPNETANGNPLINKKLIKMVKEAGFKSIRIPVSYLNYIGSDSSYTIDSTWLNRVQEVVDMCIDYDLYVIINMHADGYVDVTDSWLLCGNGDQTTIKAKYEACWTQIANKFKDYDEHLIFESMNEEFDGKYETPSSTAYANINAYNQIFVDTVRQTGGNNDKRWLLIPGWNTNINYTADNYGFELPSDDYLSSSVPSGEKRIMISVHYYDPWEFCGTESSAVTQWGDTITDSSKVASWGDESYMNSQFKKMSDTFVDKGYPVVIGEYGSIDKNTYDSTNEACRADFAKSVCTYSKQYGFVPFYWDNGYVGNHGFALFDRQCRDIIHPDIINAIMDVYGDGSDVTTTDNTAGYVDVWSGNFEIGEWANQLVLGPEYFEKCIDVDSLKITYSNDSSGNYHQVRVVCGDWTNKGNDFYSPVYDAGTKVIFDFTDEDLAQIKQYGMIVYGAFFNVEKISFNGVLIDNLYSQSTAVTDSKYSKRWVYMIPESEVSNVSSVDFKVTRGDGLSMTANVKKCYKGISAESEAISYDGYVWVCYAITGIPEDVTLTAEATVNTIS